MKDRPSLFSVADTLGESHQKVARDALPRLDPLRPPSCGLCQWYLYVTGGPLRRTLRSRTSSVPVLRRRFWEAEPCPYPWTKTQVCPLLSRQRRGARRKRDPTPEVPTDPLTRRWSFVWDTGDGPRGWVRRGDLWRTCLQRGSTTPGRNGIRPTIFSPPVVGRIGGDGEPSREELTQGRSWSGRRSRDGKSRQGL